MAVPVASSFCCTEEQAESQGSLDSLDLPLGLLDKSLGLDCPALPY
jgi:hypothetical protein